jgi:hypothetical protein
MAKEFNPTDWADVLALDLISIALSNPYKASLELIAAHLRVVDERGSLRGMQTMQADVLATLDRWRLADHPPITKPEREDA